MISAGPTFRLLDCLTVIAIALLLLGATLSARQLAQSKQDIVHCAKNLQLLHAAYSTYTTIHGQPPRTRYEPGKPITAFTGASSPDPFGPAGPEVNDVSAAIYLLAREGNVEPDVFNCPAALRNGLAEQDTFESATARRRSNFGARIHFNYSFQDPYVPERSADPDLPLAADTNPGGQAILNATTQQALRELRMSNSPNHQRDGQNVLYFNGSVQFEPTPFVNKSTDNMYAPGGVHLVPEWLAGPDVTPKAVILRRGAFSIAMVVTTLLLILIVLRGRLRTAAEAKK